MTMRGIDISSWQANLNLNLISDQIDFAIVKATEGTTYVNPTCDTHIQQAIERGLKWGFYHFAKYGNPVDEATYFVDNCLGYFGQGIPALDYEVLNDDNAAWCEVFLSEVHRRTGIWPLLYISASRLPEYNGSFVPQYCGLWLAGYPYAAKTWTDEDMPYSCSPWSFTAIWQFTSSLRLAQYSGNLDGNIAYMDGNAWDLYSGKTPPVHRPSDDGPKPLTDSVISAVINGAYGTGDERVNRLKDAGYDPAHVQDLVNIYYDRAHDVIDGVYGNGEERRQHLQMAGYNYDIVQSIVNAIMGDS